MRPRGRRLAASEARRDRVLALPAADSDRFETRRSRPKGDAGRTRAEDRLALGAAISALVDFHRELAQFDDASFVNEAPGACNSSIRSAAQLMSLETRGVEVATITITNDDPDW
jgi:hypothetical protein